MSPLPGFSLEERFENRDVSRTVHLYAINKDNSEHWYPLYRDADGRLLVSAKLDGFYEGELVYGEQATVPDNTETTIVSYVNSELSAVWFQGFVGTGNVDAQYKLYINTNLKMRYRTVGGLTANVTIPPVKLDPGDIVALKVIHWFKKVADFEGTILIYR
jgi:hypothetical protein